MQTLYVDVYFLLNFTVDILALYFAALFSKVTSSPKRLIITALFGAAFAVGILFMPENLPLKLLSIALSVLIIGFIGIRRVSPKRHIKFALAFFIFESLVGGIAYMLYGLLDKLSGSGIMNIEGGAENQKLLLFSMIVLLSIGVFKMIVSFFSSNQYAGSVEVEIAFQENKFKVDAFVDSGNLAVDPMDMQPVLLLKEEVAKKILPENVIHLSDPDLLTRDVRKRIRLIPVSRGGTTHVLTGIRADSVKLISNGEEKDISVTLAVDKEGGTYGGYYALMPSAAISDVVG